MGQSGVRFGNVFDMGEEYFELQNKTNNALERYNRTYSDLFPSTSHPSLPLWVITTEKEARRQVQRVEDIKYGKVIPKKLKKCTINKAPKFYNDFIYVPTGGPGRARRLR